MTVLCERAPAKVNLFLAVGPPRPDGYHPLVTVFESIPLYDEVEVAVLAVPPGRPWEFRASSFRPDGSRHDGLAPDLGNLAGRAAKHFVQTRLPAPPAPAHGPVEPAEIAVTLVKRIPVAAGLGGGSSDAAAVLRALEAHYHGSRDYRALLVAAAGLGSDVPFFVLGGRAVGRSRGEDLSPLSPVPSLPLVLGLPAFPLRTSDVYHCFDRLAGDREALSAGGPDSGALWERREEDLAALLTALAAGDLPRLAGCLRNDLEPAALALQPEIGFALTALRKAGCLAARLSGSGPAVFGLAPSGADLNLLARRAQEVLPTPLADRMTFRGLPSGA